MIAGLKRLMAYRIEKQNFWKKAPDYLFILKNQLALHSTDILTPYISLWARVENFGPDVFFQEMLVEKKAARIRAFRGTLFIIHNDLMSSIVAALAGFYSQRKKETLRYADRLGVDTLLAEKMLEQMSGGKHFTSRELKKVLGMDIKGDAVTILIRYLEFSCKIIRTGFRHPLDASVRYGAWDDFMPSQKSIDFEIGLENILAQYIHQFGPVTLNDICWWFPLTKTCAKNKLASLNNQLVPIDIESQVYYMTKSDKQIFELYSPNKNLEIVSFLPYEDHFTKAYIEREWFLEKNVTPLVTEKGAMMRGQIFPSIWLNGKIIGRWHLVWEDNKKSAAKIKLGQIFEKENLSGKISKKIENKRNELENFLNEKMVPLIRNK
jgi:hypothetical protein